MQVVLLNPPGRMHYTRDYFCSKVTKGGYVEHPVDLLILSGIISQANHKISLIDAIAENLNISTSFERIISLRPQVVIFLSGTTSWKDDFEFMLKLKKEKPDLVLIGIGDIFLDQKIFIRNNWVDGVIVDFTSLDILKYMAGQREDFLGLGFRKNGEIYFPQDVKTRGEFTIPLPRHELFLVKNYSFPFARNLPFTTLLTDYGCPFHCPFCLYSTLGYKTRKLDNVFEELQYISSLGIKELFVKDQTFGADPLRAMSLCKGMQKIGKFSWTCFLRTDLAESQLLKTMKESGCHTIMMGVESANPEVLKKYKPGINRENIERAFKLCHEIGIETVGIFIFGFPEESRRSCLETIDLALKIRCDFASFNLFVPKIETPVRKRLIKEDIIQEDKLQILDQSGIASIWGNGALPPTELDKLRRLAICKFYLRPSYLLKRLFRRFCSRAEVVLIFSSAIFILKDLLKKRINSKRC